MKALKRWSILQDRMASLLFAEAVFDYPVAYIFFDELCRETPVGFLRYNRDDAACQKVIAQPLRIESPVRQDLPGCRLADQRIGFA